eukprot:4341277-Alexandrium_andersonii.AAC.1
MPGSITGPVVHASLAIPDLCVIIRITALAYFPSVCPVVARAPAPAAWACAPVAVRRAGIVSRQRWWAAVRRE